MSIDKIKLKNKTVYRVRKWLPHGNRISKCFDRKVDAVNFEAKLIVKPSIANQKKIRFSEFALKYLNLYAIPEMEASSVKKYDAVIRNYYNPRFGNFYIHEISREFLAEFRAEIVELPMAPSTKYFIVTSLRTIFQKAVEDEYIERNPAIGLKAPKKGVHRMEYWTEIEVRKFLSSVCENSRFPLYMLAFNTGMRLGELFALKWDCIDFERNTIRVQRTYCQKSGKIKETTKTNRSRSFGMNSNLGKFLRELKLKSNGEFVLNPREMGCRNPAHASRSFSTDAIKAKVRPIRFHDIRHTYATQFADKSGGDIHALSAILGHSSTAMTDRYAHFGNEHVARAANVVSFAPPENNNVIEIGHKRVIGSDALLSSL